MNIIESRLKEQDKILNMCHEKHNEDMYQLLNSRKRSKKCIAFIHLAQFIAITLILIAIIISIFLSFAVIALFIVIIALLMIVGCNYMLSTPLYELFKLNNEEHEAVREFLDILVSYDVLENFDIVEFEYIYLNGDDISNAGFYFMTFDKTHFCECENCKDLLSVRQILKITHYSNYLRNKKIEYKCM